MTEAHVRAAFRSQARACGRLGSPLMERLLAGLADGLRPGSPVADRVLGWQGEAGPAGDAVPLRLAGGLHALILTGADAALATAYRRGAPVAEALAALDRHAAYLMDWLDQPPQTNEVRRSAALVAAGHEIAARFGLPLELSELGCSAGLNLLWDRCRLTLPGEARGAGPILLHPDWDGPLPPSVPFAIAGRAGVDLNPLDPVADRLRLLAYLWPDQPDRAERTEAALVEVAHLRPVLTRGDAADWLQRRLAGPLPGRVHVVFHTIAWQYFPPATQARCTAALEAAGARATEAAPLAHLALEADGQADGAALTLRMWPGGELAALGRVCFHGRWVRWAGTG
ncbi:DUF2332 domain-containing protein [Paragemmobacter ruber]|uniref:DUF2332 family protein n=1 Tax=Paragemmobacter ruber TaxID=1985673 RepID=A0ABW9Y2I4_9RHOB|nr:DUF2332 family protein [Rhodobacter ruber]NBE06603.1 DUF2332 family protein [Rhodobacter ruber]